MSAPHPLASQQYSESPQNGRALWEFEFEEKNCCHVNFIGDGSAVQDEKEFQFGGSTYVKMSEDHVSDKH